MLFGCNHTVTAKSNCKSRAIDAFNFEKASHLVCVVGKRRKTSGEMLLEKYIAQGFEQEAHRDTQCKTMALAIVFAYLSF